MTECFVNCKGYIASNEATGLFSMVNKWSWSALSNLCPDIHIETVKILQQTLWVAETKTEYFLNTSKNVKLSMYLAN
jgi:hypothetical protein